MLKHKSDVCKLQAYAITHGIIKIFQNQSAHQSVVQRALTHLFAKFLLFSPHIASETLKIGVKLALN